MILFEYNTFMLTKENIKVLFEKYDVAASKRFGQNFLIDESVLNTIMEVSDCQGKDVIEVGPGLGSLTVFLLENAKTTIAYEIDNEMIKVLDGEYKDESLTIIQEDFTRAEFTWKGRKTLVANIPYYITSDILFHIFGNSSKFDRVTLMIQKEVAQRLAAPVGSKTYSTLTVTANLFAENIKLERIVKPESFLPAPKIDSAIITFDLLKDAPSKELVAFIKKCFVQRRKTLFNNLRRFNDDQFSKDVIAKMNLKESVRPQELTPIQFKELFNLM